MFARPRISRSITRAALIAAVGLSMFPTSVRAATRLALDQTAWFWSSNQDVTTCTAPPAPAPPVCGGGSATGGIFGNAGGVASPISPGHMGVGMKNGNSDMRAYLKFDTSLIPPGATIDAFVVTLSVSLPDQEHSAEHATFMPSGQGHTPATVNQNAANIVACAVKQPFGDNMAGGGGGDPPYSTTVVPATDSEDQQTHVETTKNEPFSDCSLNAGGTPSKDGATWTFNITSIAQAWSSGTMFNEGIALLPQNTSIAPTWTIEFHGNELTLAGKTGDVNFVNSKHAGYATVDFSGGGDDSTEPPPTPPASFDIPPSTIDIGPLTPPVDSGGGTEVLGEQIARPPTTTTPVAFAGSAPGWVYSLLILLALGLALLARVIGIDPVGLALAGESSRVASVLHSRRLSGEAPVHATEAILAEELDTEQ